MSDKLRFLITSIFICTLSVSGCDSAKSFLGQITKSSKSQTGKVENTAAEEKKAKLLKQIDRKFENPDAHFQLGELYQQDGLWMQAEREYNTTLSFDPAHRKAQAAMVKVFITKGAAEKAQIYADIYMSQVANSAAESLKLAMAFQRQQLDEYALGCYRQALDMAPNSAKINRQIGYYYLSKSDNVRAKEYLRRSFRLNPNQPEVAGELGRLGVEIKVPRKKEQNVKKLDEIVEQNRDN